MRLPHTEPKEIEPREYSTLTECKLT